MSIEPLFKTEVRIENKKMLYILTSQGNAITELRMIQLINDIDAMLNTFYHKDVSNIHLVFVVKEINIPSNFTLLDEFAQVFIKHREIILDKLQFTVLQNENNLFRMFFALFKKYYNPLKPLYLCKNEDEVQDCLHDQAKRHEFNEIMNQLKDDK
tara:strand:+ start:133 stop:597 length:465 start_codon:yes stop_codon:yes gene_type:complete